LGKLPDFSLVGFEIQQDIQKYSDELKRRFPNREIDVIYSAVSSRDGLIEYFEPTKWGKNYKGGTTTVRNKNSMEIMYDQPNVAPSVDFAKWLREHISNDHFVFVKMDIEGGEYNVIEHLLNTGAINLINVLAVEWHAEKFPEPMRSKYIDIEKRVKQYAEFNQITVLDWY
jgi:FkbM family methyltransferase